MKKGLLPQTPTPQNFYFTTICHNAFVIVAFFIMQKNMACFETSQFFIQPII